MRRPISLTLLLLLNISGLGQARVTVADDKRANEVEARRLALLSDLQFLASDSLNLREPLARAAAQTEVADVAWTLDRTWAKKLLREAYEMTLPPEEDQTKLRNSPAGSPPVPPTPESRARDRVRRRILTVANRERAFGEELTLLGAQKLGKYEEQLRYSEFADQAVRNGDIGAASDYVLKALRTDPTQANALNAINEIAKKDRAAADSLILQYFALLRSFPVSYGDQSDIRTLHMLYRLVFPHMNPQPDTPPPGPAVMRAYVSYVIDTVSRKTPEELQKSRLWLLSAWGALKQYAPELTQTFLDLEVRSRRPGETVKLPEKSLEDEYRKRYQKQVKDSLENEKADEQAINAAISRGDFDKARKLIDKLADGPQKIQLAESTNLREAVSLTSKGDNLGAERLAGQLNKAASILQVYPLIIERCIGKKDQACASNLVAKAVRQLKQADTTPATPPAGIPLSAVATSKEADPVLMGLNKLAKLILPIDETLALEVLNEMIAAANRSEASTEQGGAGFEADIFKAFAAKNETQSLLAAQTLTDRLRRIVSLAAIYKQRAEKLTQSVRNSQ